MEISGIRWVQVVSIVWNRLPLFEPIQIDFQFKQSQFRIVSNVSMVIAFAWTVVTPADCQFYALRV